jgi:hypothetical protein
MFHSPWRWLAVPVGLLTLVFIGRGVTVAAQDLHGRSVGPTTE